MHKSYHSYAAVWLGWLFWTACQPGTSLPAETTAQPLSVGPWRGTLTLGQGQATMPFNWEVMTDGQHTWAELVNGDERLRLDSLHYEGDSVRIPMHIFDAQLVAHHADGQLTGYYQKLDAEGDYRLPFAATHGVTYRFAPLATDEVPTDVAGRWAVTFTDRDARTSDAIGQFVQTHNRLTGTFLTPTGDYRFLEGVVQGSHLQLSGFDGANAYLFTATVGTDSTLAGEFWSGKTGHRQWQARRDSTVLLPDADQMTTLRTGYDTLALTLPDLRGDTVSLDDPRFANKVLIVQVFGSWCPNCMDETAFLAPWYQQNRDRGVEVIGLAFERKPDLAYARQRVQKVIDRYDVQYPFLLAGTTAEADRARALPMLDRVRAFPTTLFVDRQRRVRRIHTGFSGPGTGEAYTNYVRSFGATVDTLLAEPPGAPALP